MSFLSLRKLFGLESPLSRRQRLRQQFRLLAEALEMRLVPAAATLHVGPHETYSTISAAVVAANPGDTIQVDPGTYDEMVTVGKANLTIEGAQMGVNAASHPSRIVSPTTDSIVQGPSGQTAFVIAANDVTIDGFTVQDATNANVFGAGIYMKPGFSGTHLKDNIIQDNLVGLFVSNNSSTDQATIQKNLFRDNTQPGPASGTDIYADQFTAGAGVQNILIQNNTFTNTSFVEAAWALGISNTGSVPFSNITFWNNSVTNHGRGVYFYNTTNSAVIGNVITGATHYAVGFFGADAHIQVLLNDLSKNAKGVYIADDGSLGSAPHPNSYITVHFNNFAHDSDFGLGIIDATPDGGNKVAYTGTLDARFNLWGSITGPTYAKNPIGHGSALVTTGLAPGGTVNYFPWLIFPVIPLFPLFPVS
jgi:hypothetical protein